MEAKNISCEALMVMGLLADLLRHKTFAAVVFFSWESLLGRQVAP